MLEREIKPDWEALMRNLRREGTPKRVQYLELFLDGEVQRKIFDRFGLLEGLDPDDPRYNDRAYIRLYRFLGYDYVSVGAGGYEFPHRHTAADDTTDLDGQQRTERTWMEEHKGPVTSWEDFESYPWPDPANIRTDRLEWFSENLPDDTCIFSGCHNIFEQTTWLMSYEGLSYALYDQSDLVDAVFRRVGEFYEALARVLVQFDRVKALFGGDDMGFKTQTMISPQALREKSLPWHRKMAEMAHENGKLYILHACGNLDAVMEDLIEYAKIDARHSFEDVIEPVTEASRRWGDRIAILGGIDMDFLGRADEAAIRARVRETLDVCMPGGGYCLGSGNSIANYIPVDSYLAMIDEGRRYA